jgi:protein PhnA
MGPEERLKQRSGGVCELCGGTDNLKIYEVLPSVNRWEDDNILTCATCNTQIEKKAALDSNHWNCLSTSMWSETTPVQIVSWRMLNRLRNESWAADNLDMMYMEEEQLSRAKASGDHESDGTVDLHRDCNGQVLQTGDTVVLTKSLDVKGTSLNAKMGTVVKNIRLVPDNTDQIEGKIEGQVIVILTKYLRKQS